MLVRDCTLQLTQTHDMVRLQNIHCFSLKNPGLFPTESILWELLTWKFSSKAFLFLSSAMKQQQLLPLPFRIFLFLYPQDSGLWILLSTCSSVCPLAFGSQWTRWGSLSILPLLSQSGSFTVLSSCVSLQWYTQWGLKKQLDERLSKVIVEIREREWECKAAGK